MLVAIVFWVDLALVVDAVDEPSILNVTKGETITCSANASVSCIYRWFYGNDTLCPVSCNQVLTTNRLEDHSCEASCTVNGLICTFIAMRIFVLEDETSGKGTLGATHCCIYPVNCSWRESKTTIIMTFIVGF